MEVVTPVPQVWTDDKILWFCRIIKIYHSEISPISSSYLLEYVNRPLKLLHFCYSLLITFIHNNQSLHNIAFNKLFTCTNRILNLFNNSSQMHGLLWIVFLILKILYIFLLAIYDLLCKLLISREKCLTIYMFENLV